MAHSDNDPPPSPQPSPPPSPLGTSPGAPPPRIPPPRRNTADTLQNLVTPSPFPLPPSPFPSASGPAGTHTHARAAKHHSWWMSYHLSVEKYSSTTLPAKIHSQQRLFGSRRQIPCSPSGQLYTPTNSRTGSLPFPTRKREGTDSSKFR